MLQQTTEKPRKTAIHQRQTLEIQLKCTRMRPITDIPISYTFIGIIPKWYIAPWLLVLRTKPEQG